MNATIDEINQRLKTLSPRLQKVLLTIIKSWQSGGQRTCERKELPVEIDVLIGDRVLQTSTKNISASGVFIKTSEKVGVQKDVRVVFMIPGMDKPFRVEGRVVRSEPGGVAVEFQRITPYFKCIINDALWKPERKNIV